MSSIQKRKSDMNAFDKLSNMPVLMINDLYQNKNTTPIKSTTPNVNLNSINGKNSNIFEVKCKPKKSPFSCNKISRKSFSSFTPSAAKIKPNILKTPE